MRRRDPYPPPPRQHPSPAHGGPRTHSQPAPPQAAARTSAAFCCLAFALTLLPPSTAAEGDSNANRARLNYMLNCQGCHLPDGRGIGDIPQMKNFVGNFLRVPGGREFIVQVPGVANAPLTDAALAELLNWMLAEISPNQLPDNFQPYAATEVGRYRAEPLADVQATRTPLIQKIAALFGN